MINIHLLLMITLVTVFATACNEPPRSSDIVTSPTPIAKVELKITEAPGNKATLNYQNLSPQEAKKMMGENEEAIILDVRTEAEYIEKHIPGSILIPVEGISAEAPAKLRNKDATILVYCRSGRRSVTASETLVKLGYTHIYNFGGIIDWPYEIETGKTN